MHAFINVTLILHIRMITIIETIESVTRDLRLNHARNCHIIYG